MKQKVKAQLPTGFKSITMGGGDSWKPEKVGTSITGVMSGVKVISMPAKGKKGKPGYQEARDVNLYTITTKDGTVQIFQSAGLKALESIKKGKAVYVQYIGKKVITKGHAPMREYLVATK